MRFFFFLFFSLSGILALKSQSLTGTNGFFKIPSAYVLPDGYSYIGASFYPKGYYEYLNVGSRYTGMPTFITLSLFDRVEFMFRYTHQLGHEVNPQTRYFPDRMFTLRYNFFTETERLPAFTLGLHDISEALGGTTAKPWFLSTYLVASKSFDLRTFSIKSTLGYAYDIFGSSRPMVFNGVFGGVELSYSDLSNISLIGEYDSDSFNIAVRTDFFGHLNLAVGLLNLRKFSGFFTYRFNLSNR